MAYNCIFGGYNNNNNYNDQKYNYMTFFFFRHSLFHLTKLYFDRRIMLANAVISIWFAL